MMVIYGLISKLLQTYPTSEGLLDNIVTDLKNYLQYNLVYIWMFPQ